MTPAPVAPQPSVFDLFKVGIGPSSSHTVGPMRAGAAFSEELQRVSLQPETVRVELFGSLAATGRGHWTDRAVLLGLGGADPATVPVDRVSQIMTQVAETGRLPLARGSVPFDLKTDLTFEPFIVQPDHVNALKITAKGADGRSLVRTYYSTGGGFVLVQKGAEKPVPLQQEEDARPIPYPFQTGDELLELTAATGLSIADVERANESAGREAGQLEAYLDQVLHVMFEVVHRGCETHGILPGGLGVERRAAGLREKLEQVGADPLEILDWVTLYALAVNEENAAGHRVVTAPTNGAAGVVPAVLGYLLVSQAAAEVGWQQLPNEGKLWDLQGLLQRFPGLRPKLRDFLLAAAAAGSLVKRNASIAGAEVGCQGEIGSASAMAAAGLAQALGGSPAQVENAAEIAMEHSLGLTCDPVGGLVQIPCIERNAIGAVKAISAARMALYGQGRHQVSLDVAIETMRQTGVDMHSKYKETSVGGLAVNVVEC